MAVALRGSAVVPTANPTTGFSVAVDAAVLSGDWLELAFTSRDHTSGTAMPTVTDNDTGGNTWTVTALSADRKALVARKRATSGTAGKTVTVAGCVGSTSGVLKAWSGTDTSADPVTDQALETNASGDESHAGFTPTNAGSMVCAAIFNYANDNAVTTLSFATLGATTMTEKLSTGGLDCATAFGHALQSGGPSATGTLTWAQTNGTTYSVVWALKPLAADTALAGSSAGGSTASGVLTTAIRFAGSSAGVATAAGALATQIALAGASAGSSTAQGSLSSLVGSSAGTSTAAGALTTVVALAGASAAVSGATAALTTAVRLAGTSAGSSSAAGVLTTGIALSGGSAGVASAVGSLTTAIALVGSAPGVGTAAGALTTSIRLAGTAAGGSTAVGTLTSAALLLAGSSAGSSGASGILTTAIILVGSSAGIAGASGALSDKPRNRRQPVDLYNSPDHIPGFSNQGRAGFDRSGDPYGW